MILFALILRHKDARPETTRDILARAIEICPQLAPPAVRLSGRTPSPDDLLPIVEMEIVGFRPSRKPRSETDSGLRLERGEPLRDGIDVVFNYGHGGFGWQSCWGCAEAVVELLGGPPALSLGQPMRCAAGLRP